MQTFKIRKPYVNQFLTLLNGETVSYSTRVNAVAIGRDAVSVTPDVMAEIANTSNDYGEKFRLVVSAWNSAQY